MTSGGFTYDADRDRSGPAYMAELPVAQSLVDDWLDRLEAATTALSDHPPPATGDELAVVAWRLAEIRKTLQAFEKRCLEPLGRLVLDTGGQTNLAGLIVTARRSGRSKGVKRDDLVSAVLRSALELRNRVDTSTGELLHDNDDAAQLAALRTCFRMEPRFAPIKTMIGDTFDRDEYAEETTYTTSVQIVPADQSQRIF